jgi:hypothetical protein
VGPGHFEELWIARAKALGQTDTAETRGQGERNRLIERHRHTSGPRGGGPRAASVHPARR